MNELFSAPDLADFPQSMHLAMVRDAVRLEAYTRAINSVVSKGDVVLDVGSGTCVLSILAAQAGASKVYAVENSRVADYARQVVEKNGLSDVIEVLNHNIFSSELPSISADVVISEFFGTFGIGENVIRIMKHVRDNYMKTDGVMMPGNMDIWVAPIQCSYDYHQISNWDRKIQGIDFSPMQELAYNAVYDVSGMDIQVLAEPCMIKSIDFLQPDALDLFADAKFEITSEGVLHGVAGWFSSKLNSDILIDTGPHSVPTHWGQIMFPCGHSHLVKPGDCVDFSFEEINSKTDSIWRWKGGIQDGGTDASNHQFCFEAQRQF